MKYLFALLLSGCAATHGAVTRQPCVSPVPVIVDIIGGTIIAAVSALSVNVPGVVVGSGFIFSGYAVALHCSPRWMGL